MMNAYAGDLSPAEAWTLLNQEGTAALIDVRTEPEWRFVGLPDLGDAGKQAHLLSWQVYPSMEVNPRFMDELRAAAPNLSAPALFICRSGARSAHAAAAATAAGYTAAYNVAGGFEGDLDGEGRRGAVNGWKVDALPWRQG